MQTISSSEARNHLSAMLDKALREPVLIQKQGRNAAVLLSYEEYERLSKAAVTAFDMVCDDIGRHAAEQGMTEEKLASLLQQDND